jgi:hypothetical protein
VDPRQLSSGMTTVAGSPTRVVPEGIWRGAFGDDNRGGIPDKVCPDMLLAGSEWESRLDTIAVCEEFYLEASSSFFPVLSCFGLDPEPR